jgi:hypothetical protein
MKLTRKQENLAYLLSVAMAMAEGRGGRSYGVCMDIVRLESMARKLRNRYTNACSYQWADTDAYRRGTSNLEARIKRIVDAWDVIPGKFNVSLEFQTDPRGSSMKLSINGLEYRL